MKKKLEATAAMFLVLFIIIYFCADYAVDHSGSWAAPFAGTYPIGLTFGILALILVVTSQTIKFNGSK